MLSLQHYYLEQMGIERWVLRKNNQDELSKLERQVSSCQRCELCHTRTKTVFSRGSLNAKLMIIGEAPGFNEDQQGRPFVGKAGQLLDKMLFSINFSEKDVYIANVLKCRPPNNRDPVPSEIENCSDYLNKQIKLISPTLIFAVGRYAGQFLTNSTASLGKMRSMIHYYQEIPVIVSYHPAYLLRNPKEKKNAYRDLLAVQKLMS